MHDRPAFSATSNSAAASALRDDTLCIIDDERGELMSLSYLNPATERFEAAIRYARLAEELGYESVNCAHIAARDSFTLLSALAMVTERISLATAVVPIYHRSPASMAQTAAPR